LDHNCLLRNIKPEFCSPLNPLYIGLHGHDGNGGRIASAEVPKDYRGTLLADSPAKDSQQQIYRAMESYVKSFEKTFDDEQKRLLDEGKTENEVRIKSLYLWSESPGTGKTTTAAALLNEYLLAYYIGTLKRRQTPKQRPCYFLDANALQTDYNTFNRPRVPEDIAEPASRRYYNAMEYGKHTDFVVIDDIGTRKASEPFKDDLHSVINHRVTNQLPTVYTSNLPIEELKDVFNDERLPDRIKDLTEPIHFGGESKRGARRV